MSSLRISRPERLGRPSAITLAVMALFAVASPLEGKVIVKDAVKTERGRVHPVVFRMQPVIAVRTVHLAGTFNGWRKDATPLAESGSGRFEVEVLLPPGKHEYKFVVNGDTWLQDKENPERTPDGNGGFNSVVHVGHRPAGKAGKRGDGKISAEDLIHDPDEPAFIALVDDERRAVVRLHVLKDDVTTARLEVAPSTKGGNGVDTVTMTRIASVAGRDVYEARVFWPKGAPQTIRYGFVVEDGKGEHHFGVKGLRKTPGRFRISRERAARFKTPDWVRDAIFYQIFPDRFCNGDPSNDGKGLRGLKRRPKGRAFTKDDAFLEEWGARPSYFNVFGGDLAGIKTRLDWLEALGVNAIYLNPVFPAWSNHRYDAASYTEIDPRLGTVEDFQELCRLAKARGIRIILDAVFNHTGHKHWAFLDVVKKGKASKYRDWYFFEGFPVKSSPKPNYRCWWDFGDLPQLNTANPEVVAHLYKVAERWLKLGGAGWRLDVPNEVEAVNPKFWAGFRESIRKAHPEAYIVGEIWTDARPWLNETKFDATMNYPVRRAALDFIVRGELDAAAFDTALAEQRARLPEPALRVQFNLLGSHDTARVKHVAKGAKSRVQLAYGFLFCYLGAPVVYYGDEVGVTGGKDPDCRRCFPWDEAEQDRSTLTVLKRLAALRRAEPALRRGRVEPLLAEGRVHAFRRVMDEGESGRPLVVVLNTDARKVTVRLPAAALPKGAVKSLYGGKTARRQAGRLVVELGPRAMTVLAAEAPDATPRSGD